MDIPRNIQELREEMSALLMEQGGRLTIDNPTGTWWVDGVNEWGHWWESLHFPQTTEPQIYADAIAYLRANPQPDSPPVYDGYLVYWWSPRTPEVLAWADEVVAKRRGAAS